MYIGKEPIVGNFQKCDAITVVNGQAAYTLQVSSTNVVPESANHMLVSLNGILQAPVTSFTVSGSTLTFASNLATGDVIDFVILLGNVLDLGKPSDGTVTNAKLAQDIISGETDIGGAIADADLFLMDDGAGGTLRKTAASRIKTYIGSAGLVKLASTTISSAVPAVAFDNNYITSTYDNYKLVVYGLSTASDNQDVALQFSVDNGSNFATHKGHLNYTQVTASSDNTTGSTQNLAYIPIGSDEEGDDSGGINAEITIFNVNDTAQYTYGHGLCTSKNQNGEYYTFRVGGYIASNTAVNYLKVYTNGGGNLDKGTCTLYGITK